MKKITLIIGARPNFIKAFPLYEALKNYFSLTLIHTGQHFDNKMSDVFFNQLKFPRPDIHLTLEKKTRAGDLDNKLYIENDEYLNDRDVVIEELMSYDGDLGQMGEIRDKLLLEFEKDIPDLVIVFGDVTSTLAAGLAARKSNIDLAHVESGLRSGDIKMPEEVNRVLTDHITKYYFVTEQSGVDNLKETGFTENVYLVGNTMIDTQKKYLQQALDTKYHETLDIKPREYILITLHRPSNVDDIDRLKELFDDFDELSKKEKLVYPIHPRTKNNLEKVGYLQKIQSNPNIILDEPLGYLEFTCLMANSKYVITDSGGLQEETTSLDIPCFTLRENTERPSTLIENNGTNQLINKISEIELKQCKGSMGLWDGKSSEKIYENIYNMFDESLLVDKKNIIKVFYKESFIKVNLEKIDFYEKIRFSGIISELFNNDWNTLLNIGTGHGEIEKLIDLHFDLKEKKVNSMDISWYDKLEFNKKIKYIKSNINCINDYFPEKSIDIIVISEVMEHLDKELFLKSLENLKKIVKIKLVITVPFNENFPLFQQSCKFGHQQSFNLYKIKQIFPEFDLKFIPRYNKYWAHLVFKPLNIY